MEYVFPGRGVPLTLGLTRGGSTTFFASVDGVSRSRNLVAIAETTTAHQIGAMKYENTLRRARGDAVDATLK